MPKARGQVIVHRPAIVVGSRDVPDRPIVAAVSLVLDSRAAPAVAAIDGPEIRDDTAGDRAGRAGVRSAIGRLL